MRQQRKRRGLGGTPAQENVAGWAGDPANYTPSHTTCKHCRTPSYNSTCPTCAAWLRVHAAYIDMSEALEEVRCVHR